MDTNIVHIKSVSVWRYFNVLSNTEAEFKKSVAYKKSVLLTMFTLLN